MSSNTKDNMASEGIDGQPKLSDGQTRLLSVMLQHVVGKPEFDWDAIVANTGYKNANVAKTVYAQIKKKLGTNTASPTQANEGNLVTNANTPTKVGKRTGKVGSSSFTPTNKTKTTGRGKKNKMVKDEDNDEEDSGVGGAMDASSLVGLGIQSAKKQKGGATSKSSVKKEGAASTKDEAAEDYFSGKHSSIGGSDGQFDDIKREQHDGNYLHTNEFVGVKHESFSEESVQE